MNPNQKMSLVLISIILLSATALAAPATDHTKAKAIKAPLAAFSASPTSGNAQLEVQFTDESTGTPTSWKWSFGDGKYSTAENPVHTYSKAGKYTVSLTVKNAGGTNKIRKHNYITVYTATTPDKEAPVINSVILSNTAPETGDSITVTVDVTDNVGVSSVKASGVSLVNKGENIWEGSIVAEEGTHAVSVSASDVAGNTAIDESASYTATTSDKTAPVINSVTLSDSTPETGNSITVTVDVTDNVGVNSVTASGVSLVNTGGNIWGGSIVAEEGTHTVSVSAYDNSGNAGVDESVSYTATTSDKTAPLINSVSLSSTTPETGDSITVTVDVTDNVGVSSVTTSGVSLVNTGGNIWKGDITAIEGTHTISVTASDAAGNSAVDESASYTATTTSTAVDPVCHMTVNKSTAKFTSVYNGKTYYFCSASCKETFDANPESFL